ncbi:MAG: hypothetical protein AB9842_08595 [Bacteroidales bacterium]
MNSALIESLMITGEFLEKYCQGKDTGKPRWNEKLEKAIHQSYLSNQWFIEEFVLSSLSSVASMLKEDNLRPWLSAYPELPVNARTKRIGIISAGNIPVVGFHDFLCVLVSGHTYVGKLSAQDNILLPLLAGFIAEHHPDIKGKIFFPEGKLEGFDAVIATGSNNTSRYFEYYFRNYPKILRRNRNSVAILDGSETPAELELLGDDIFLYFGLGCRNVSKLFVPAGYDLTQLFPNWTKYSFLENHNKYQNNHSYFKSIFLINRDEHLDNSFILVKPEPGKIASPVSVLFTGEYQSLQPLTDELDNLKDQIQCIVGKEENHPFAVPFGMAQNPGPEEYADGIDTLKFLTSL